MLCPLLNDWNYFWNKYCNLLFLVICVILKSKSKNWTENELAKQKMINYHIKRLYKTKTKSKSYHYFSSHWLLLKCFFLFTYQGVSKFWKIDKISWASFHYINKKRKYENAAMGIGGRIRQCRRKCRPMLVLRRQKNAVVKLFTYAVFLFRFYSVVDNYWKI